MGIRPRYADAWANLGMAETALGKEGAALESLQKALCFDPRHRDALTRLAALLKKLGRGGEAVAFYERTMAEMLTADMHFEFGELLFGLGQRDRPSSATITAVLKCQRITTCISCMATCSNLAQGMLSKAPDERISHSAQMRGN